MLGYENPNWIAGADARCYQYDRLCDAIFLKKAWVGYKLSDQQRVTAGLQPVDFGFGEFWGSSYYETLLNTVGLENIDNLGIKYKFADDKYNLTLGFYPTDGGNYKGTSKDSSRYSGNFVEADDLTIGTNIKEKNIDDNKGLLPESFETYQIIEPNDIVFRFTDLQNDKRSLRNAISKYHGIITSAYIGVKTKENADFYNYLFRAYDLQKVFYSMGDGMRQSLKMDELNKMPIVLPKIEAQERIVKFINEENQRINNLVVKQKNLIEKLKEYRASIISHAVTGKIDVREFGA